VRRLSGGRNADFNPQDLAAIDLFRNHTDSQARSDLLVMCRLMKIVIQNPQDLSYFVAPGRWSKECREAMVFENFRVAVEWCTQHKLGAVQVVLKAEEEPFAFPLPVIASVASASRGPSTMACP
jgi:hypothetical protein